MNSNLGKFKKICSEKGILTALGKALSYIAFISRKKNFEKTWKGAYLTSGRLEVRAGNTGPKIYWNDSELTKDAALNTAIFTKGKWYDSSRARWSLSEKKEEEFLLRNAWKDLPIKEFWKISVPSEGKISCEIELDVGKDIEFIEQKFSIMLQDAFDLWSDGTGKSAVFPDFSEWADIKTANKESIFARVESRGDKNLPAITLKKKDGQLALYMEIQNSGFKTRARLLNFVASSKNMDLKYKKGKNPSFKMEIGIG